MDLILPITTAFLIAICLIPIFIKIVKAINVLDQPDRRKLHSISTPSLGGIPIYLALIFALIFALPLATLAQEKYILGATFLIFLLGIRDDISSLLANHKLFVQVFASIIVVFFADIKIAGLNGLFGIETFGWYFDEIFTIVVISILTNAFNLIDGIDGLAGSIGVLLCSFFATVFYLEGEVFSSVLAIALAGGILAFLIYNWYPSKVFMGDTGSLMLGFVLTVLLIRFLGIESSSSVYQSPVSLMLALFVLPVYDTLRVFVIRLSEGNHPLAPDRNHVHHVMLRLGYNHGQATIRLVFFNFLMAVLVFFLRPMGDIWLILSLAVITISTGYLLDRRAKKKEESKTSTLVSSDISLTKTA